MYVLWNWKVCRRTYFLYRMSSWEIQQRNRRSAWNWRLYKVPEVDLFNSSRSRKFMYRFLSNCSWCWRVHSKFVVLYSRYAFIVFFLMFNCVQQNLTVVDPPSHFSPQTPQHLPLTPHSARDVMLESTKMLMTTTNVKIVLMDTSLTTVICKAASTALLDTMPRTFHSSH